MPVALFNIQNSGLDLFVNLLVLFLVVVWLALVAWTYLDARRRVRDDVLVGCAAGASFLFPYVGSIVYAILRPPELLDDARERELEIRAAELRVRQLEEQSCPNCEFPLERAYLRCPRCRARVKDPCESCGKPIDPRWRVCPYCETPVQRTVPPPEPPARRAPERPAPERAAGRSARSSGRASRAPDREERPARPSRAAGTKREAAPRKSQPRGTVRDAPGDRPAPAR